MKKRKHSSGPTTLSQHKANREPDPQGPRFALPITYSDLTDRKPTWDEVDTLIARFDRNATFFMLAMLNTLLSFVEMRSERAKRVQEFLFQNLCDDDLFERAKQRFGREQRDERPLFHRQQLLTTMRRILLRSPENGPLNPNSGGDIKEARFALGKLALMFNDLNQPSEQTERLGVGAKDLERLHDELFVQLLPSVELTNPPNPARSIVRNREYLRILEENSERFVFANQHSLATRFRELTGIDPGRYLLFLYCIWARYEAESDSIENLINEPQRFNIGPKETFSQMNVAAEEISYVFKLVATDISDLGHRVRQESSKEGLLPYYGFREFRERPLVYTNSTKAVATVIDMGFLVEKMSTGVFHTIAEVLKRDSNQSELAAADHSVFIRKYWGDVFEIYVNERFAEVFAWSSKHFHPSPTYDGPKRVRGKQTFDGLINYGGSVVVMEYKGKFLKLEAKYGENRELLINDLNERFGKAVRQLAENIELCFNQREEARGTFSVKNENNASVLPISNTDIEKFGSIYPLIVVQEHSLSIGFANRWLRNLFSEEITGRSVDLNRIRPLSLITIEDLEFVLPYMRDLSLGWILDEYAKNQNPLTSFKQIFRNLIKKSL